MDPIQKPSLALGDLVGLFAASASNPDLSRAEQALAAQMAVLARHVQYVGAGLSRFVREHRALDKTVVAVIESVKAIQDGAPAPAKQDRPPAPEVDADADPEAHAIEQWAAKAQQEADEEAAAAESVPVPAEVPTPPVVRKQKAQRGNGRQA